MYICIIDTFFNIKNDIPSIKTIQTFYVIIIINNYYN